MVEEKKNNPKNWLGQYIIQGIRTSFKKKLKNKNKQNWKYDVEMNSWNLELSWLWDLSKKKSL